MAYSSSFALTEAKRGGRSDAELALPLRDGKMEEMSPFFLGGRTWVRVGVGVGVGVGVVDDSGV